MLARLPRTRPTPSVVGSLRPRHHQSPPSPQPRRSEMRSAECRRAAVTRRSMWPVGISSGLATPLTIHPTTGYSAKRDRKLCPRRHLRHGCRHLGRGGERTPWGMEASQGAAIRLRWFCRERGPRDQPRVILPPDSAEGGRAGRSDELVLIVLHMKATADEASWSRRACAASALKRYVDLTWRRDASWWLATGTTMSNGH